MGNNGANKANRAEVQMFDYRMLGFGDFGRKHPLCFQLYYYNCIIEATSMAEGQSLPSLSNLSCQED